MKKIAANSTADKTKFCNALKQYGHSRKTSKKCKYYVPRNQRKGVPNTTAEPSSERRTADEEAMEMAKELEELEALPFQSDESDAFYSAASSEYVSDGEMQHGLL